MNEAERQHVRQAIEAVECKRRDNAERIAGCPLERWLERRTDYVARGSTPSTGWCRCHCHRIGQRAA